MIQLQHVCFSGLEAKEQEELGGEISSVAFTEDECFMKCNAPSEERGTVSYFDVVFN